VKNANFVKVVCILKSLSSNFYYLLLLLLHFEQQFTERIVLFSGFDLNTHPAWGNQGQILNDPTQPILIQ